VIAPLHPAQKLTEIQRRAVEMIGAGHPTAEIADKLGIRLATLWDWRYEPAFSLALRKQNEAIQTAAFDQMTAMVDSDIGTVRELLKSDSPKVQLAAAKLILDKALAEKEDSEEDLKRLHLVFARDLLRHLNRLAPEELVENVRRFAKLAEDM